MNCLMSFISEGMVGGVGERGREDETGMRRDAMRWEKTQLAEGTAMCFLGRRQLLIRLSMGYLCD